MGQPLTGEAQLNMVFLSDFFKKVKKIKFEKECRRGKFLSTSRLINGREVWGRTPPAHPTGGRCQIFFPRASSRIRGPSRGGKGIPPAQRAGGAHFLIFY
jgi:hypothetical protein